MTSRRPTISDVARRAGVSKGAVSFALNDRPGVAPETRDRILAVARELGWTPSHRARALAASRSMAVGLVIARPPETLGADPFFPSFIAGIESALAPLGQSLLLQVVPDRERELAGYRRLAADGRVDGVFLTDLRVGDPRPALLAEARAAGGLDRPGLRRQQPAVRRRRRPARHRRGRRAPRRARPPAHRPRRRAGRRSSTAPRRREAWAGALRGAGLPEGPCVALRLLGPGRRRRHQGAARPAGAADRDRLRQRPDGHRRHGGGRSRAASSVPGDLSITGFDDTELAAPPPAAADHRAHRRLRVGHGRGRSGCSPRSRDGPPTTPSCRRRTSSSEPPPHHPRTDPSQQHPETENR